MDGQVLFETAQILLLLYFAYKIRQGTEHLRVMRKHLTKAPSSAGLSPKRAATFKELTGRDPEPALED